jgi:hypothetical protein
LEKFLTGERNNQPSGPTERVPVRQRAQAPGYRQQRVFPFFFIHIYHINHINEENNGNEYLTGKLENGRCFGPRILNNCF